MEFDMAGGREQLRQCTEQIKAMRPADEKLQVEAKRVQLMHVHVCPHCGYLLRREEVDGRQVASGMFHCPKCDLDGPLNMEIRDVTDVDVKDSYSRGGGSSGQG